MSETYEDTNTDAPFDDEAFSFDLNDVNLKPKLIADGAYLFSIVEAVAEQNKGKTGWNYKVTFATVGDTPSTEAVKSGSGEKDIAAGRKITKWYPLQQSTNDKAPDFRADLTRLYMAVYGVDQKSVPKFNSKNDITGRQVVLKITTGKEDPTYGASNEIQRVLAVNQSDE